MSTVHADIAVVGGELCALAAGAALAHAGHRVVVIDDEDTVDVVPLGGVLAPAHPTLWRLPSNGPSVTLVDKLGLRQDAKRALGSPVGMGVVDDPDVRMAFPLDEEERAKEFGRVFGEDVWSERFDAIDYGAGISLLSEALVLHDDGFFARRREKKRVDEIGQGQDPAAPALRAFSHGTDGGVAAILDHLAPFVVHASAPDAKTIAGLLALARLGRGTLEGCEDGLGPRPALRQLFLRVIQGHGGDLLENTRATALEVSGRRVTQVKTASKNDFAVRAVIDGTRDRSLPDRLPDGRVREKARKLRDALQPGAPGAILRWVLPRAMLPRGTTSRVLLLPQSDEPSVLIGVFDAVESAKDGKPRAKKAQESAPTDDVVVVAVARSRAGLSGDALRDKVARRVDSLFPFALENAKAKDALDEETVSRVMPTFSGEASHALGGRRPRDAAANWARAGRDLTPRFGIEGEMAAAQSVAALVETMLAK